MVTAYGTTGVNCNATGWGHSGDGASVPSSAGTRVDSVFTINSLTNL